MSQENVERFRRGAAALKSGDLDAVLDEVAEDVEWIAARSAVEGPYQGHAGLRRFMADTAESFEVFEPEWHELRDLGDRVLAIGTIHIRARGSGVDTEISAAGIATYRDGKLTRWEDFRERRLALDAAGLTDS
jgi:ketosteroid isomerase-like protein